MLIIIVSILGSKIASAIPRGILDPKVKNFEINNMTVITGEYESSIVGNIKNISNETLHSIGIILDSYNANNQLLGVDEVKPSYGTLEPGQDTSFEIGIDDNIVKDLDHYVVGIKASKETRPLSDNLTKNNTD